MGYYDLMYNATKYDEIGCDFCLVKKIGLDNIYKEIDYHIFYANKIDDNLLNQKLCYRLDNDGVFTDFVWLFGGVRPRLAVSEKFKCLIEKFKLPKHQMIPVYLDGTNDVLAYIINIYEVFDLSCVDIEKSKGVFHEADGMKVLVPFFRENVIGDFDIFSFKDVDNYPRGIYVSKRLRKAIKEEGITGCSFSYRDSWYYKNNK